MSRSRKGNVGDRVILKKRLAHIGHPAIIRDLYLKIVQYRPYDQLMYSVNCSCGSNLYGISASGFDLEGTEVQDSTLQKL